MKSALMDLIAGLVILTPVAFRVNGQGVNTGKLLVPHSSWDCGMADGIPNPEGGTLIFDAQMKIDRVANLGRTPYGVRQVVVTQDGTVSGSRFSGVVSPGALDFELTLANGVIEVEQILVLRTNDGKYIYTRAAGTGPNSSDVRVVMDFEAPASGEFAWLNSGKYVARRVVNASAKTLSLRVYDVSGVAVDKGANNVTRINKPAGVPEQPWDSRKKSPSEKQGDDLITETVTLSPSQSVGASKRGNRNIIPITGGELTGRIKGKVLPGGADYQNLSPPATIDARYLWETADGEVIIVRNAGPFGALVPTFEARSDSPYAWLNKATFLSSNPGMKPGGVGITMYESSR